MDLSGGNSQSPEVDPEPLVACVLVTWNNREHTERCLLALGRQGYSNLIVIVVDNGSTDGSLAQLRGTFPQAICIENGDNLGFARACNIGAHRGIAAGAEYLWFLNNDTEAPPDTAGKLVKKALSNPRFGVIGAVLFYLHDPITVQAWGGGRINLWSGFNRHFVAPAPLGENAYITFASALVRRQTFQDLGGLWEGLFLYFEDSDFSLRAAQAGWVLGVAEDTAILHAENGSITSAGRRNPLMERVRAASGLRFLERHGAVPPISMAIFLSLRLGKRIASGDWRAFSAVLAGAGDWCRGRITPFRKGA